MRLSKYTRIAGILAFLLSLTTAAAALDRNAFTFTRYDLEVRLTPETHGFAVSGKVTVRNDSNVPQRDVDLQITSSLAWTAIGLDGKTVPYVAQPYTSDIDHTGLLSEAILTLPQAVAPRASVTLDVVYEGTITKNVTRLERIGTPADLAYRTDWDEISPFFMGVRSLGHVNWFPIAMDAVSLSAGNTVFDAGAAWAERQRATELNVTITAPPGLKVAGNADSSQVSADKTTLQFRSFATRVPTFVVANFEVLQRPAMTIYYLPEHTSLARDCAVAGEKAIPLITEWFGAPRQKITVIELPDSLASPFESGEIMFMPMQKLDADSLELSMVHPLVHSAFPSNRKWVFEGVAHFAQTLVIENLRGSREMGLAYMEQFRPGLAAAETIAFTPNNSSKLTPESLVSTNDEIYYRVKGAYVWIMLRELIGDEALKKALRDYRPEADTQPAYLQSLVERPANPLAPKLDLEWFFDDWVYRDKGLAEFKIDSAYPRESLMSYIVTVTVSNTGNVQADVSVVVQSPSGVRSTHSIVKANSKVVLRLPFPGKPDTVIVNDGTIPEYDLKNNRVEFSTTEAPKEE